jgi:hypothetical protein
MPHALFVHSWLTKNKIKDKSIQEKRTLRKLHLTENVVVLTIAGMVNAAIMIMAAAAFNGHYSNIASKSDAYNTLIHRLDLALEGISASPTKCLVFHTTQILLPFSCCSNNLDTFLLTKCGSSYQLS